MRFHPRGGHQIHHRDPDLVAFVAPARTLWRAIATPRPPDATAMTLVKLLPLATAIFGEHGRSAIQPHAGCFHVTRPTVGTAKFVSVNGRVSPFGRIWRKGIHTENRGQTDAVGYRSHHTPNFQSVAKITPLRIWQIAMPHFPVSSRKSHLSRPVCLFSLLPL